MDGDYRRGPVCDIDKVEIRKLIQNMALYNVKTFPIKIQNFLACSFFLNEFFIIT